MLQVHAVEPRCQSSGVGNEPAEQTMERKSGMYSTELLSEIQCALSGRKMLLYTG